MWTTASAAWSSLIDGFRSRESVSSTRVESCRRLAKLAELRTPRTSGSRRSRARCRTVTLQSHARLLRSLCTACTRSRAPPARQGNDVDPAGSRAPERGRAGASGRTRRVHVVDEADTLAAPARAANAPRTFRRRSARSRPRCGRYRSSAASSLATGSFQRRPSARARRFGRGRVRAGGAGRVGRNVT